MITPACHVADALLRLKDIVDSHPMAHAWSQQRAEELLRLTQEVATGRGGREHLSAMRRLAGRLAVDGPNDASRKVGEELLRRFLDHAEIFASHVETGNCPTGDCPSMTPAPCQMACPAGIDVPGYVALIGQGRDAEAIDLIRQDNPLPWVCGLVCTNPCEYMCVRGRIDAPVAIKHLKAFAAERAMSEYRYRNPEKLPDTEKKVAVIGAGPAGLTAAYYLALKGHRVTIIEGLPVAGGMMMIGIPRYRLPREVIDREVDLIESLGVEIRYNTYLGYDVTFESLRAEGFEAFLIAMGAQSCLSLKIRGENDMRPVVSAIEFLRRVALGERHPPGRRAAVIGGGNVAIDAARTLIRLGAEKVTIVYRRARSEMPANPEEVDQAEDEGVDFMFLAMPLEIVGDKGLTAGLHILRTELGPPDEKGRRRPIPIEGSDFMLDVDLVVTAVGQATHSGGLGELKDLKWSHRGTVLANTACMSTSLEGVFAAGDMVTGPATVVEAIGGGKRAAEAIHRYLRGLPQPKLPPVPVRRTSLTCGENTAHAKMAAKRPEMPLLGPDRRRVTFQQVELGYDENAVRKEAERCLRCDICIRCGTCVRVCRDLMGVDALHFGHLDFDRPGPTDFRETAERCITCGACAANCPTGAMSLTDQGEERILSLCGTVLNRVRLNRCSRCGAIIEPGRYHHFVNERTRSIASYEGGKTICGDCARKAAAGAQAEVVPPDRMHR